MSSRLANRLRPVLLAAGWLLGGTPGLLAQNTVNLTGRVTGATGAPLVAAQVTVSNRETGQQRSAVTSAQGTYTIVGLPPGAYHVSLRLLGYGRQERDIQLLVGQHATLDFQLQEAAVAVEGVEVVHQREPSFEVQRNDVSALVVTNEIINLPLNTRNTINLAAIVPGLKTFAPTAGRSLPAAGSLPDLRFWNFYLDGAEWKSFFNGNLVGIPQTGSPLPQEAMREFRVHLNPYDAQYTRGASFVISAVTQRGTNEVHGSVFGYGQATSLRALDLSQREYLAAHPTLSIPDYGRAQLGFNLRGPIQRDKLFFAVSYEGQSIDDGFNVVPVRPPEQPTLWDTVAGTFKAPTQNHTGVVRLTAPVSGAHTLDLVWAGRYYNSETNFGDAIAHNAGIKAKYWIHSLQFRDTYTPTSSFANELSLNLLLWSHNESPLERGRPGDHEWLEHRCVHSGRVAGAAQPPRRRGPALRRRDQHARQRLHRAMGERRRAPGDPAAQGFPEHGPPQERPEQPGPARRLLVGPVPQPPHLPAGRRRDHVRPDHHLHGVLPEPVGGVALVRPHAPRH